MIGLTEPQSYGIMLLSVDAPRPPHSLSFGGPLVPGRRLYHLWIFVLNLKTSRESLKTLDKYGNMVYNDFRIKNQKGRAKMDKITLRRDPNSGETVAQYGNARQVWRVQDGKVIEYSLETYREYRGRMQWVASESDMYVAYTYRTSHRYMSADSVPPVPETVDDVVVRYGESFYT